MVSIPRWSPGPWTVPCSNSWSVSVTSPTGPRHGGRQGTHREWQWPYLTASECHCLSDAVINCQHVNFTDQFQTYFSGVAVMIFFLPLLLFICLYRSVIWPSCPLQLRSCLIWAFTHCHSHTICEKDTFKTILTPVFAVFLLICQNFIGHVRHMCLLVFFMGKY